MLRLFLPLLLAALPAFSGEASTWNATDPKDIEATKAEVTKRVGPRFDVLVSGPWILATDLDRWTAKSVLDTVVNGAAVRVREQVFPNVKITRPIVIYVLRDISSYMSNSQRLFQEVPPTEFGYYDRRQGYILTHAGRGFGPMLHEMVHVLAESDFPNIPPWLNEGMGSLFEEYVEKGGQIEGVPNWRLGHFKYDVSVRRQASLRTIFTLDYRTLYGANTLSYYTTLRHTMLYLQEQNKAIELYRLLRDRKATSPEEALRALFNNKLSLDEIERDVRLWALSQRVEVTRSGPEMRKHDPRFR